jgi:hypothetical protein
MKAVDSHFEGLKPRFDAGSVNVVQVTAQPDAKEGSQVSVAIDQKRSVREIVFLGESSKKLSCWIGSSPFEEIDAEQ